eukprot:452885-Hanusia_phi.AAC.1
MLIQVHLYSYARRTRGSRWASDRRAAGGHALLCLPRVRPGHPAVPLTGSPPGGPPPGGLRAGPLQGPAALL